VILVFIVDREDTTPVSYGGFNHGSVWDRLNFSLLLKQINEAINNESITKPYCRFDLGNKVRKMNYVCIA
jgi:hypothetical protein